MVLAKDETIVKEWEYAKSRTAMGFLEKVETKSTLTVTNKRLISTSKSDRKVEQQEIPIQSIKSISCSHEIPSILSVIIFITLGVLALILALVLQNSDEMEDGALILVALVLAVLGVCFIIAGIKRLNQGIFKMVITTTGREGEALELGATRLFKRFAKSGKVKVQINNDVIKEIIDTLGAIIIENK